MAQVTAIEILNEQSLSTLEEKYYEEYRHDNRLPELFELIEEDKLCGWFIKQFEDDFSVEELQRIFDYNEE